MRLAHQNRAIAGERREDLERIFYAIKDRDDLSRYNAGFAPLAGRSDDDELADFLAEHLASDRSVDALVSAGSRS